MRRVFPALLVLALGASAFAQRADASKLGVSVSAYWITDSKLREVFGDPAVTYGLNYGTLTRPRENRPSITYNLLTASRGDSTFVLIPVTVGYEKQFANQNTQRTVPYARLEVGGSYYDVSLHDNGYDDGFKTFGVMGAAEVGVVFNKTLGLKARYNLFQDRFGINLSGIQVGLTFNFFRL